MIMASEINDISKIEALMRQVRAEGKNVPGNRAKQNKSGTAFDALLAADIEKNNENQGVLFNKTPLDGEKLKFLAEMIQLQLKGMVISRINDFGDSAASLNNGFRLLPLPQDSDFIDSWVSNIKRPQAAISPMKIRKAASPDEKKLFIDDVIKQASEKYDVVTDLIRSVIQAESDFNPDCTSPKGAMGLMQLMPETAKELEVTRPYDIQENIMGGTRYLKMLLDRYAGNKDLALAAYNWGMGNLERDPENLPEETRQYIARVNRFLSAARV